MCDELWSTKIKADLYVHHVCISTNDNYKVHVTLSCDFIVFNVYAIFYAEIQPKHRRAKPDRNIGM
jgi:hypothetical protein